MTVEKSIWSIIICILLAIPLGCGRKKPPLPPIPPKPVEVLSIGFSGNSVITTLFCHEQGIKIVLFGKPKGICPLCTEGLKKKAGLLADKKGRYVIIDKNPESRCMVYRIGFEKGDVHWLGDARIVCRQRGGP